MSMNNYKVVHYDKDKKRKPSVQAQLDAVAHKRTGDTLQLTIMGESGRVMPILVQACRQCGNPAPMIANAGQHGGRFVCRDCVLIFG